ncbi:uncharacterized protein LOC141905334 [Tubulanus polymorphus]|uniref:uncharacterized protein LOC141905334 n=1 Tax=Tubulanus polymorphus TaxID=672921 RepID=UPI003DA4996C
MGHKDYCCVPGCGNRRDEKAGFSFYSIPLKPHERHKSWLGAIGKGFDWVPTAHTRICSLHFVGGKKNNDPDSPSYIPTLHLDLPVTEDETRRRRRRPPVSASLIANIRRDVEGNIYTSTRTIPSTPDVMKAKTVRSLLYNDVVHMENGFQNQQQPQPDQVVAVTPKPAESGSFSSFIRSLSKENTLNLMKQSYVKIGAETNTTPPSATVSVNPESKPNFQDKSVFGSGSMWKDSNHSNKLLKNLARLWNDQTFADVVINVGFETFHAHRIVVAAASPFMASLLSNVPLQDKCVSIELPCDPRAMKEILNFMYTGTLTLKDETVYPILYSAQMLNVEKVRYMCEKYVDINKLPNPEKGEHENDTDMAEAYENDNSVNSDENDEWNNGPKIESCFTLTNGDSKTENNFESSSQTKRRKRKAEVTMKLQPKLRVIAEDGLDEAVTVKEEPDWEWDDAPEEDPPMVPPDIDVKTENAQIDTIDEIRREVDEELVAESSSKKSRKRKSKPFRAACVETVKLEEPKPEEMKDLLGLFGGGDSEVQNTDVGEFINKLLNVHDIVSPSDLNLPEDTHDGLGFMGEGILAPYSSKSVKSKKNPDEVKKQQQGPFSRICAVCFWRFPSDETAEKHIRKNHPEVSEAEILSKIKEMRMLNAKQDNRNSSKNQNANAKSSDAKQKTSEILPDDIMISRQFISSNDRTVSSDGIKQKAALAYVCCHCDSKHESLPLCLEHVRDCPVRQTGKSPREPAPPAKIAQQSAANLYGESAKLDSLDRVERDERGRILYHCDECQYKTTQKYYLPFHRYYKHSIPLPDGIDVYECEVCHKKHPSAGALRDHMLYHSTSKDHQFVCSLCKEVFKTVTSLRDHTRRSHHLTNSDTPKKEKQYYQCDYPNCIYRTRYKNKLYTHSVRHSGAQPEWLKPKPEPDQDGTLYIDELDDMNSSALSNQDEGNTSAAAAGASVQDDPNSSDLSSHEVATGTSDIVSKQSEIPE